MFEEPEEGGEDAESRRADPKERAKAKSDEFRMFAEQAAVFEGVRKFEAQLLPGLDPDIARECQRGIGKLEKSRVAEFPVVQPESEPLAAELLDMPTTKKLSTNDYHIHRRPGEVMILRWLAGEEAEQFYTRLQAHFDAALGAFRDDQHTTHDWKQDPQTLEYLKALDALEIKMAERYAREAVVKLGAILLSIQSVDEMDIMHLCDFIMGVPSAEVVGENSAPSIEQKESERTWFFKLFSLRGMKDGLERMFFFTYLQRAEGEEW